MSKRAMLILAFSAGMIILSGCGLLGGEPAPPTVIPEAAQPSAAPTSTPLDLAPTLAAGQPTASPTPAATVTLVPTAGAEATATLAEAGTGRAPTPLPSPTRVGAEAQAGESTAPARSSEQPGISISPQLGEPRDVVKVDGDGFESGETVRLHWTSLEGDNGPVYYELEADEDGSFTVDLIVLPAERWPGGPPQDGDELQLRAVADSLDGGSYFYYANFKYISRGPQAALALTYENDEYGYEIQVPSGWEWSWSGEDTSRVQFTSPGGGEGFVRVASGTDVEALIPTTMSEEYPGQTYTTGLLGAGSYPGTQATTTSGHTVQFIPANGRTYVLSFQDDLGQTAWNIVGSFVLR